MHTYLFSVVVLVFLLSFTRALGLARPAVLVAEEHSSLAYAPQAREDAVAREIRRHDEYPSSRSRPPRLVAYEPAAPSRLDRAFAASFPSSVRLAPMVGSLHYEGAWSSHVSSHFATGILLSRPLVDAARVEMDLGFARFGTSYYGIGHTVHQAGGGAHLRLDLIDGAIVTPYIGGGLGMNYFIGLSSGPYSTYNDWLVSGILSLGGDISVTRTVSLGLRGSYYAPAFHRPHTAQIGGNAGNTAAPGYEDAAMLNTGFYKFMGLVSIDI